MNASLGHAEQKKRKKRCTYKDILTVKINGDAYLVGWPTPKKGLITGV